MVQCKWLLVLSGQNSVVEMGADSLQVEGSHVFFLLLLAICFVAVSVTKSFSCEQNVRGILA
jgi:hypothetical protein